MIFNCEKDGIEHEHASITEVMRCLGGDEFTIRRAARTRPVSPGVPAPTPTAKATDSEPMAADSGAVLMRHPDRSPTGKQLQFISNLGGSWRDCHGGKRSEASRMIELLKDPETNSIFSLPTSDVPLEDDAWSAFPVELAWRKGKLGIEWDSFHPETGSLIGVPTPAPYRPMTTDPAPGPYRPMTEEFVEDPAPKLLATGKSTLKAVVPLLTHIPTGYYAGSLGTERKGDLKFLRVSRPKGGAYRGCMKVQTLHADRLSLAWVLRPSGVIETYNYGIEDYILMLISNHAEMAHTFAMRRKRCCRCGIGLTDERSLHYGIGPECEKHRPDIIMLVDLMEENAK